MFNPPDGQFIDCALNLLIDRWNCRLVQVSPGIHERQPLSDVETWVESTDGQLYRLDAFANYTVEEELRIGQIPLNDMRGFVNHQSGEIVTRGLNTEILDLETVAEDGRLWLPWISLPYNRFW